jgi:hypothetical protein
MLLISHLTMDTALRLFYYLYLTLEAPLTLFIGKYFYHLHIDTELNVILVPWFLMDILSSITFSDKDFTLEINQFDHTLINTSQWLQTM